MFRLRTPLLVSLLVAAPLAACTPLRPGSGMGAPEGKLITVADIERSGARTAWEVLQWSGTHLLLEETQDGDPLRITSRGQASLNLDERPLIVVDGARTRDVRVLWSIPARAIASMRVLTGVLATRYHGTGAGGGAVEVRTRSGPDR